MIKAGWLGLSGQPYQSSLDTRDIFLIIGLEILIRYFYRLFSGPEPLSTFEKERAWHVTEELNLASMQVGFGFFK